MASGKKCLTGLLVAAVASLYVYLIHEEQAPNPLPPLWDWLSQERPLADGVLWQERLGARPTAVVEAGDGVAVEAGRTAGGVLRQSNGGLLFPLGSEERGADWVTVAGSGDDPVVVSGARMAGGYDVRDARTGRYHYRDEAASAVWGYRDALLDLRCDGPRSCELRRYRPGSDEPLWSLAVAGAGGIESGADPELAAARLPSPSAIDPGVSGPGPIPRVLGFQVGRREILVVDADSGRILQELESERNEQLTVVGGRIISSTATRQDGICVVSATGYDAVTGGVVWGPHPYNLRTASGAGCEHRQPPTAAGGALVATGPDGRELVLDAYDGRVLWTGAEGERIESVSPQLAVVRSPERTELFGVSLGGGGDPLWRHTVHEDAGVLLSSCGVIIADRRPDRLRVVDPGSGADRLTVRTGARAAACTGTGLVIADGRSVAMVAWADTPARQPVDQPAPEGGHDVDSPPVQK